MLNGDRRNSGRRRDRLEIIAVMLETARVGAPKTKLVLAAGLNSAQVINYLSFLLDMGLLETSKSGRSMIYRSTSKGTRYLKTYREIGDILQGR